MKRYLFWGLAMPLALRRLVPAWVLESPVTLAARHPWMTIFITGAALGLGALTIAASGVVPLKASDGHWPLTEWLLRVAMERSIVTHSLRIDPPPLDDPALAVRGARHYDLGCSPCHGSVFGRTPAIPQAMLPPPPYLPPRISRWRPEELFYIVKHGVKLTGMPAWPSAHRDDEVWAVVAFLRRLPRLDPAGYERLARGHPGESSTVHGGSAGISRPRVVREVCARCHEPSEPDAAVRAFPRLAGQRAEYMDRALRAYADGRRHSGIMGPIAANLHPAEREAAVRFYASLTPPTGIRSTASPSAPSATRGHAIATAGVADTIPACVECHGPSPARKNPAYPIIAGQDAEYLRLQLRLLKARRRGGSEYVHLMHSFVDRLTDTQIDDVTAYFASLPLGKTP